MEPDREPFDYTEWHETLSEGKTVEEIYERAKAAREKPKNDDRSGLRSLKGCLHEYANPALRELEEGAWERAAAEKYLEKMKDVDT